jgi:plastocyanin
MDYTAYAFEMLTVPKGSAGSATLTKTVYEKSGLPVRKATLYVNPGPNIRFTLDGTTATTGTGHAITAFMGYDIWGHENIKNFQTVSTKSATAGSITVTYFR